MRKTICSLFACCLLLAAGNGDRFVEEDILSGIPEPVDVRCGEPVAIRFRNAGSKPVTWTVFAQKSTGMENPDDVPSVFGTPMPEVAVPDADEEGRPVLRGRLLPFSPMLQVVPMDDDPVEERITVGAGEAVRVEVWRNVEEYDVPFTLRASNPESGGKRTYTGTYRYHRPYDYFILKREPGDAP